jgi:hypothetical protein
MGVTKSRAAGRAKEVCGHRVDRLLGATDAGCGIIEFAGIRA